MNKTITPFCVLLLFICGTTSGLHAQGTYNTIGYSDINNIKAANLVHGDMWYNPVQYAPSCEYPKNSGKHLANMASIWMSGYDAQNNLHVAAQTYRQTGNDYWPGPLNANGLTDSVTVSKWARIWKVNRTTIDSFRQLSAHTVANTPASILEWPAKGSSYAKGNNGQSLVITTDMAPFKDINGDGIYNPLDGDYPDIKGDQMQWNVYNDAAGIHANSHGNPFHVEVHLSSYGYNRGGILDNVIYYEYKILNKSSADYFNYRIAMLADLDLGYAFDDFIGYDSVHRMGIVYNGRPVDGAGQPNSYGDSIPIAGVSMIQLPGDGIQSPQPAGSFMTFNNDNSVNGNPSTGVEYDNYLRSKNRAGTQLTNPLTGASANYIFPDDPYLTGGWSECGMSDTPGDRRFVIASNSFLLEATSSQTVVMALVVQPRDTGNACPNTRFTTIKNIADTAWGSYYNPPPSLGVTTIATAAQEIKLYPNPAGNKATLETGKPASSDENIIVYDAMGRKIEMSYSRQGTQIVLNTSVLQPGIYTLQYRNKEIVVSKKLEKL